MNHPTSSRDAAHGGVATIPLQRELILASAGSGKTHHIAKRLIALLARGEPPESILASTFTRKAAGEILDRVLDRLASAALDGDRARALSRDVAGEENALGSADWQRVLERVAESLHRLNIGTLDSFFMRVARSFAHELKLPAGWRIADEPVTRRIVDGSLQDVLSGADPGQRVEMVRELNRADVRRSVHETLRRMAENALAAHHELDPHAGDPWCALELATGAGGRVDVTAEAAALADALDAVATTEPSRMAAGLAEAAGALRERDWDTLLRKGPGKSVLTARAKGEMPTYYKRPIPDDAVELLERSFELARVALAPRLSAQVRALGRFVRAYHEARERRQGESGAYRFEDVTRLLGGPDPIGERGDLYFRLDARVRHILLDEFQDTSPLQWEALSPLVEELLAGDDPGRSAVIVADPKQSIYGWRGAEPGLVLRIGEHFGLRRDSLHWSWRSSQVVLDAVNGVFSDIEKSPAFEDIDIGPGVARDWAESFNPHVAGKPELPGHVRIEVGAADDSSAQYRPRLLRYAAERVAALHADAPGFTIGVLTRTNKAVARLIFELRRLGVPASEEGGNPLTDSAAVVSVLALLRLVDHPGDGVARYHVARTPVGPLVGLTDPADEPAARRAAAMVRRRLLDDGWGTTIAGLAASLRDACDARDRRRLGQLTELAWRWEPDATLRTMDFVALVEAERVEDATTSQVRVMTVHRSKGLEFDIVVLPELDTPFFGSGRGPSFLPYRPEPGSRITAVYPYLAEHYRPIFPEVEEAFRQHRRGVLLDTLSALYVAMTRARHALHIVVSPDGKSSSKPKSPARVVREALAPGVNAWTERQILFESGDPRWYAALRPATGAVAERSPIDVGEVGAVELQEPRRRSRMLPRRSPSEHGGATGVELRQLLRLGGAGARTRGTLVHAWFQTIEWLDDGLPERAQLARLAEVHAPDLDPEEVDALIDEFHAWLAVPDIRRVLERAAYPPDARVLREAAFAHRDGDVIVEGIMDRVVLIPDGDGEPRAAEILDFKTDDVSADSDDLARRAARYAPQLEAYRKGLAATYGMDPARITTRLVFVRAGVVIETG